MKAKCVSAIIILVITLVVQVDGNTAKQHSKKCGSYSYFDTVKRSCQICSMCKPGTYVKRRCRGAHDTTCKPCPRGYYSKTYRRFTGECVRCQQCGERETVQECSRTSDTVCGDCPLGTYWSVYRGRCMQCSYCFPDIFAGYTPEEGCQKPGIPSLHQCSELLWKPYSPPYLIPEIDDNGNKFFISSDAPMISEGSTTVHYSNANTTSLNEAKLLTFDAIKGQINSQTVTSSTNRRPTVETTVQIDSSGFSTYKILIASALLFGIALLLLILTLTCKLKRKKSAPFKHKIRNPIVKRKPQDRAQLLSSAEVFA